MNFYENFVKMCNQVGKSPSRVAQEVGISKSIVSRWKNGGGVTDATIRRVADYFGVSVGQLKEFGTLEDMLFEVARDNKMHAAVDLLKKEKAPYTGDESLLSAETLASLAGEETKKPADQKASGLRGTGYDLLNDENRAMIDSLIDSLLRSQSAE